MNHSDYRLMAVGVKNERHEIVRGKEILANISRFSFSFDLLRDGQLEFGVYIYIYLFYVYIIHSEHQKRRKKTYTHMRAYTRTDISRN